MGDRIIIPRKPSRGALQKCFINLYTKAYKLRAPLVKPSDYEQIIFNYQSLFTNKQLEPLVQLYKDKLKLYAYVEVILLPTLIEPKPYWVLMGGKNKSLQLVKIFRYFEGCLDKYLQFKLKTHKKIKRRGRNNPQHFLSIEAQIKAKALKRYINYQKKLLDGKFTNPN